MKFMKLFVVVLALLLLASCSNPKTSQQETALIAEVKTFLDQHPEYGRVTAIDGVSNWTNGLRQRVSLDDGRSLLFYTKDGGVVTVYEDQPGEGSVIVWGDYETYEPPQGAAGEGNESFPSYKVLFSGNLMNGTGRYGGILIPSISLKTPAETRESIARRIAEAENFSNLSLYSTEEAYKANISESYSKAHPGALHQGYMGMLEDGKFIAGENLNP